MKVTMFGKTREVSAVEIVFWGVLQLVVAYLFALKAIDTGSWWFYLLTILSLGSAIQSLVRLAKSHGQK